MVTKSDIATAARKADDECGRVGLRKWVADRGIDLDGFEYCADQRALRAAMAIEGRDLGRIPPNQARLIRLQPETNALMPVLSATWMDGFACAFTLLKEGRL